MLEAQRAKYSQDEFSKTVLMATKDAKLVHLEKKMFKKRNLVPFNNTMEIRESFKNADGFEKISLLIESEELRTRVGKEGRKTVVDHYSVTSQKNSYLDAFNKLLKA